MATAPATLDSLTRHSAHTPDAWGYVTPLSQLPVSAVKLHESPALATVLGFSQREEVLHVPVDTVLRQLVYDKDEVSIKVTVWMPLMGGLY